MREDACAGRRLQNLVDAVVKRSKLSYAEAYASLEVPVVPPPAQAPQSSAGVPPSGMAVHTGIPSEQDIPAGEDTLSLTSAVQRTCCNFAGTP